LRQFHSWIDGQTDEWTEKKDKRKEKWREKQKMKKENNNNPVQKRRAFMSLQLKPYG